MKKKYILITIVVLVLGSGFGFFYYKNSLVQTTDLLVGIGNEVINGQTVVYDYRAFLYEESASKNLGKEFDSSYRRNQSMRLVLGAQQQLPGLEKAIIGMKSGGQRLAILKPSMAYGEEGAGDNLVPPNSKVVFLLELRSIE
jgi:FKBP-type peptidyl-prolyl cis-trans isomerase